MNNKVIQGREFPLVLYLVAEAAWVTVASSILGWALAQHAPVIPFTGCLLITVAGAIFGARAPTYAHEDGHELTGPWRWWQAGAGAGFAYLGIALGPVSTVDPGWLNGLLWPIWLLQGKLTGIQVVGIVVGITLALVLWRRSVLSGLEGPNQERLNSSFRIGLGVIALAAVANAACGCGMLSSSVVGTFFLASLGALALVQLPSGDIRTGLWTRVVLMALAAILVFGLLLAYVGNAFGSDVANAAQQAWAAFVEVFVSILTFLLTPVLEAFFWFVEWLNSVMGGDGVTIDAPQVRRMVDSLPRDIEQVDSSIRTLIELALLVGLLWVMYRGFMLGFRSGSHGTGDGVTLEVHESLATDKDALADMADLLLGLVPEWMRPNRPLRPEWRYPVGQPGVTEAFILYFAMLDDAMARGWTYDPSTTPAERVASLEATLAGAPVEAITTCFNRACYAEAPTDIETLEALHNELKASDPN